MEMKTPRISKRARAVAIVIVVYGYSYFMARHELFLIHRVSRAGDNYYHSVTAGGYHAWTWVAIPASDFGCPLTEEDCASTWSWFTGGQALYQKAAAAGRAMMFTVDP